MEEFQVVKPVEVITLAQAKAWCKVDYSEEDDLINWLISSARAHLESQTGLFIGEQIWDLFFDGFPKYDRRVNPRAELIIPKTPLISVVSLKYLDTGVIERTVLSNQYRVLRGFNSKIQILDTWPEAYEGDQSVTVRAKFGYKVNANPEVGEQELHDDLFQAMRTLISFWFNNRDGIYTGMQLYELPKHESVERICQAHNRVNI